MRHRRPRAERLGPWQHEHEHRAGGDEERRCDEPPAAAEAARRRSGVEALFRSDHYLSVFGRNERGALDAWGTICALAARTTTLQLGTLVSPASFRHPSILAKLDVRTRDGHPRDDAYHRRADRFLGELEWYARALKAQRASGVPY